MAPDVLFAAANGLGRDILVQAGGAAAVLAVIGMALVIPLFLTQRRELKRLERWRELEPERGDDGLVQPSEATGATSATGSSPTTTSSPSTGAYLSPAERVTADRPALERITAERAAIQSPSAWRRLIARGPRHPLALSLMAILVAGGLFAAVYLGSGSINGDDPAQSGAFDRGEVALVVLNASGTAGLADRVADDVTAVGFTDVRTGATGSVNKTVVLFAKGKKREGKTVARELGVKDFAPMDRSTRSIAPDADVVVIAGEDRARA